MHRSWSSLAIFGLIAATVAHATPEADIQQALSHVMATKISAIKPTPIAGVYGVYSPGSEQAGPRAFVDEKLTMIGNGPTAYTHLTGPARGKDLTPAETGDWQRTLLANVSIDMLPTYVFGNGVRKVLLFSAYDCPNCRALEQQMAAQAKKLNATVYIVPTALRFEQDPMAKPLLRDVLCAADKTAAWNALILRHQTPEPANCSVNPTDYATLHFAFPVRVPDTVPTAVTMDDGKVYPMALRDLRTIFGTGGAQ